MDSPDGAETATPPSRDGAAGAADGTGAQPGASKSWEKLDIDQVRRGDTGKVSRFVAGTRVLPLAGALAGLAALGAVAGAVKGLVSRRGR